MQIKGASFSSFFEYIVLPKGGFIHLQIISDGPIFDYGQLFHHETFVMPYVPRPICCHLGINTTGRTNRVKNKINPESYHTFNNCSVEKSVPDKTSFLANLEVIV